VLYCPSFSVNGARVILKLGYIWDFWKERNVVLPDPKPSVKEYRYFEIDNLETEKYWEQLFPFSCFTKNVKQKAGFRREETEWGLVSNHASSTNSPASSPCGGPTLVPKIKMVLPILIVLL